MKLLSKEKIEYLQSKDLLRNTQFGFQMSFSTIDALLYCTESIRKVIEKNIYVACSLLELSKAFDSIDHKFLQKKS